MDSRREFLRQVAAWSAGATLMPLFRIDARAGDLAPRPPSTVVVARGKDCTALVASALARLGGMGAFVKKGEKVVIKPNIGWDRKPEFAANTHPELVKALVKLALEQDPERVQVFDRSCNDPRRCYANSGIQAAVESIGDRRAACPFIDDRRFIRMKIESGKAIHEWDLYREALEADCYINVPIAKQHGLGRLTLGMKNVMGVMGGSRGLIHQGLAQKLADLNTVVRPRLTVIDATRILLRNGPQGGSLDDVKQLDTIIISADPVAADAYATTLFGLKPDQVEATVAASKMGLGEIDLTKVKIVEV